MNKPEFRLPLLQSGGILVLCILFFSFVASSGADGLGSGLVAIFSGIFWSIVFIFGLVFSILFSVIVLVTLFLGTIALSSLQKAKEFTRQLQTAVYDIWIFCTTSLTQRKIRYLERSNSQSAEIYRLRKEIAELKDQKRLLQETLNSMGKSAAGDPSHDLNKNF